jgi:hypothetical protein
MCPDGAVNERPPEEAPALFGHAHDGVSVAIDPERSGHDLVDNGFEDVLQK